MKLVLHNYWRSSASHRVRIALGLKQLDYEYVAVNLLKSEQRTDGYRAMNPSAQVPTLEITEDDGSVWTLTQSLPIIEYLDERWPEPFLLPTLPSLHPGGAKGDRGIAFLRARARALAEIVNSGIQPLQNIPTTSKVKELGGDDKAWTRSFIAIGLAAYERLVIDTRQRVASDVGRDLDIPFSCGTAPTVADCCLIPQLSAARRFGVDLGPHELLVQIEQRCLALPAFAKAAPENQPDAVKP